MHCGARSLGAAGATEGPARQLWQAILAGPLSTRRKLMAYLIIVYFHHRVFIFFRVRVPDDSCLARPWILSLQVRSLRRAFTKRQGPPVAHGQFVAVREVLTFPLCCIGQIACWFPRNTP